MQPMFADGQCIHQAKPCAEKMRDDAGSVPRLGHSCRRHVQLHAGSRLGRRRPGLVRGRGTHSLGWRRRSRDRRDLPIQSTLSSRYRSRGAGPSCASLRGKQGTATDWSRQGSRANDALLVGGVRWRQSHCCLVRFTNGRRSVLRRRSARRCGTLEAILA